MRWFAHVFAESGDKVESLFKEQLGERRRDVAAIPKQFPVQPFDQDRDRSAIIDIAWGQATRKPLASGISRQVQLKAKEPAHARLPTPGVRRKDAVPIDAFGIAHIQRSRVDEADARACSVLALQIGQHWNHHLRVKSPQSA
jgi:hypothetical protein